MQYDELGQATASIWIAMPQIRTDRRKVRLQVTLPTLTNQFYHDIISAQFWLQKLSKNTDPEAPRQQCILLTRNASMWQI